jgi:3-dehydroquinate synthase
MPKRFRFSSAVTEFHFDGSYTSLRKIVDQKTTVIITDSNIFSRHEKKFRNWNVIVLKPGEEYKIQATVDSVIDQLIQMQVDRNYTLVGVGGGVVTDITGYVASIYMRGIRFGFVPTSLLCMVDASIGGKNGIDVEAYKNMVGTIRQPSFILHDASFLSTLPEKEWQNGFAEVIKHACILDAAMFRLLAAQTPKDFMPGKKLLADLVTRNAMLKIRVVQKDEFEKGLRRLLNFGHTLGHALENQYELSHGQAVSIGITYACEVSEAVMGFRDKEKVVAMLEKYGLPTYAKFDRQKVFNVLKMDKKREKNEIHYIVLEKIGRALAKPIAIKKLESIITGA